jgi:hypothetical protein
MFRRLRLLAGIGLALTPPLAVLEAQVAPPANFFNFETAPVHPIALSPDGPTLVVCNLAEEFNGGYFVPSPGRRGDG